MQTSMLVETVAARSAICANIRRVLLGDGFQEVTTPILTPFPEIAPMHQFTTTHPSTRETACLRVAPTEFLKRLLIDGADRVFEFSTNFRPDSLDVTHLPEFTSLEVMARGVTVRDMQDMVERLMTVSLSAVGRDQPGASFAPPKSDRTYLLARPWPRIALPQILFEQFGFCRDDFFDLKRVRTLWGATMRQGDHIVESLSQAEIMDQIVETLAVSAESPVFIEEYPSYLGGPAKLCVQDSRFKERCELFIGKMEIANMSSTLTDPEALRAWHDRMFSVKQELGISPNRLDEPLLLATERGLPESAVVGIGIERLMMVVLNAADIRAVRPFAYGDIFSSANDIST